MFHHNSHFNIWNVLHSHLKRGEYEAVAREWQKSLPGLIEYYDDLRMLYYIGRFGQREPYQQACTTLTYLRDSNPEILKYRLSIFRYTTENSSMTNPKIMQWMMEDLSNATGIPRKDFPSKKLEMPESLAAYLRMINPPQQGNYDY